MLSSRERSAAKAGVFEPSCFQFSDNSLWECMGLIACGTGYRKTQNQVYTTRYLRSSAVQRIPNSHVV